MKIEDILGKLVSYETVSEKSNEDLADFIIKFLQNQGISAKKIRGEKGRFNIYSRIGPDIDGGIILSGHTDVVPTTGQKWLTNPFKLKKKKNRLYARGAADMKGFIAVVLSLIKNIKKEKLKKPLHLVFSYDEEIGCIGIQKLIPFLKKIKPKPKFCIVGEPTEMKLVNQHKGKKNFIVNFQGVESHSSLVNDGVNSISYCVQFLNFLEIKQKELRKIKNTKFSPEFTSINVGKINGGIAVNIIPKTCEIEFEIRDIPNCNTLKIIKDIKDFLFELEDKMKSQNKKCSIVFREVNDFPPLNTKENMEIISLCLKNLNSNALETVSFGTEAGVFHKLGFQTVVCGPGSIKQAHKPDEFIELSQLKKCESFLTKIINNLY